MWWRKSMSWLLWSRRSFFLWVLWWLLIGRRLRSLLRLLVLLVVFLLATYMYHKKYFGRVLIVSVTYPDHDTVPERHLRLVVASSLSSNHIEESKDMIASVQHFLPMSKIIIFDLGLSAKHRKELQALCQVEMRPFNFSRYPPHFKDLYKYAWKPTIIRSLASKFEYFFWGDASVRLVGNFTSALTKLDE